MRFLNQPYYVGLLSAAAMQGAAHQQPMVFQVMTNKPIRTMHAGKVAIQFSVNGLLDQMPVTEKQTETGTMRVATPETTAFDLVRYQGDAGHLNNAATVLGELAEYMDAQALVNIADYMRLPDVQRLGYLLDAVSENDLADPLARWLKQHRLRSVPLYPGTMVPVGVAIDKRWHILPNVELEVDL